MIYECGGGYVGIHVPVSRARARQRRCNAQLPHLIPAQMYRENSPRLRFSAYSSLNVDTEK